MVVNELKAKLCMILLVSICMLLVWITTLFPADGNLTSLSTYRNRGNNIHHRNNNNNIIFVSSSCYSEDISTIHLNFIHNVAKLNVNKNILIFCGTSECIKRIKHSQNKTGITNLFTYRLQLKELANNKTPLQSFINNHPFNRLKRGREFIDDIQKISVLLVMYKYGGLYLNINHIQVQQTFADKYFSHEWIHQQNMFAQSHINNGSKFVYEIMSHIDVQYSSYPILYYPIKWPLHLDINAIIDEISLQQNIIKLSLHQSIDSIHRNSTKYSDKHYGILCYDSRAGEFSPANAGDETQTFAGLQFLPFVDTFVDRSTMNIDMQQQNNNNISDNNISDNNTVITFLNAWYGDPKETWPPKLNINPLLFSMHFVSDTRRKRKLTKEGKNYFSRYNNKIGAVGARDIDTLKYFQNNQIDAYFSGCATILLQNPTIKGENASILIIDVKNDMDNGKALRQILRFIPKNIRHQIKFLKQGIEDTNVRRNRMARYDYSYNIIREIARAKILITSRLHSAIPGVAMNTTVLFVHTKSLPGGSFSRINGFTDLFYNVYIGHGTHGTDNITNTLSGFNWMSPPANPNHTKVITMRQRMLADIKQFDELYENGVTFGVVPFDK